MTINSKAEIQQRVMGSKITWADYHVDGMFRVKEAIGNETMLKRGWKSVLAFLIWLIPAHEETLRVANVAEAMKAEFERRIAKPKDRIMFY